MALSAPTGAAASAGTHTIAASGGSAANYTITTNNGTLTVGKAALTVVADDKSKIYGDADPALTASYLGLKYSDTGSVVSGLALSAPTGAAATAGSHTIAASGGSAANYDITTNNGTLTVGKAALTVVADDKSKIYGDADPALSASYLGLKYSDTSSVVSGLALSAPTGAAASAGTHVIAASGGSAANYTITTNNGTLTVGKAALTVVADDKSKIYGDADPALTRAYLGFKYSDTSWVVGACAFGPDRRRGVAGTHTIAASAAARRITTSPRTTAR